MMLHSSSCNSRKIVLSNGLELAMEAVQRADLLPAIPGSQRDGQLRAWEEAWLAAQLALQQITPHGRHP